ncbi:phasin family protein [Dechloromonas denitrificans]|uniref:phasin family protein n=1 Tax=Dechloromonas denitrificans TaxID=281362 RepID=UPI001CF89C79|nr:phasin family protein [Dechloromonas denitrificans]UCV04169.1 phasin family protein [Dechloromonas denitrificans]UCV08439.1 phasin family protein [Dechloromonas denitrificans]
MKSIFETITEAQKTSLEAAAGFSDNWLVVIERLTQLNIEVSRTAFEKSLEMALLGMAGSLSQGNEFAWSASVQSGIEQFSEYCQSVRAMTLDAAKHQHCR